MEPAPFRPHTLPLAPTATALRMPGIRMKPAVVVVGLMAVFAEPLLFIASSVAWSLLKPKRARPALVVESLSPLGRLRRSLTLHKG